LKRSLLTKKAASKDAAWNSYGLRVCMVAEEETAMPDGCLAQLLLKSFLGLEK
jgi:hypothetical protein